MKTSAQAPPPASPKIEAHLSASNRLLRRAADLLAEFNNEHVAPPDFREASKLIRQIDHHLERGRAL